MMQVRLHSTGNSKVEGTVLWARMSETSPIALSINGAKRGSQVVLKVCGPSMNGDAGTISDQCWTAFTDSEHHNFAIDVGAKGRARVTLYAKLGVGPLFLVRADRFELYAASNMTKPIAVGRLRGRR